MGTETRIEMRVKIDQWKASDRQKISLENIQAFKHYFIFENLSTALVKLSMVLSASPCSMPSRTQWRI